MFNPEMNYVLEKFAMQAWMKRDMAGIAERAAQGANRAHRAGNMRGADLLSTHASGAENMRSQQSNQRLLKRIHNPFDRSGAIAIIPNKELQDFRRGMRTVNSPRPGMPGGTESRETYGQHLKNHLESTTNLHQTVKADKYPPFSF